MHIAAVTLFPQMFETLRCGGVTARALERGLVELSLWDPRDYTTDKHRRVDDRPYGGGPGMVMQVQPLRATIQAAKAHLGAKAQVLYLSPQGRPLDQAGVAELAQQAHLILVAGRYEGIDERVLDHDIDLEYSIGDYVLSGGELAAMVLIDAMTRLLPGSLGHAESATGDSFMAGLLDYPHYTRPEQIGTQSVPTVLLSGDHAAIERWRQRQALGKTWLKRPDLLRRIRLNEEQQRLLNEFMLEYQRDEP